MITKMDFKHNNLTITTQKMPEKLYFQTMNKTNGLISNRKIQEPNQIKKTGQNQEKIHFGKM